MNGIIRSVAGRILGAWVATAITWLGARYGLTMDSTGQQKLVADLIGMVLLIWGTIYPLVHRWFDAKHNPVDAAAPGEAQRSYSATRSHR